MVSTLLAPSFVVTGTNKARIPLHARLSGPTVPAEASEVVSSVLAASFIATGLIVARYFPLAFVPSETWLTLATEEGWLNRLSVLACASVQTVHVIAV